MSSAYTTVPSDDVIDKTVKALEQNGIATQVVENKAAAKEAALKLIPKGSEVLTSTSVTVDEIGASEVLNGPDYVSIRQQFMTLMADPKNQKKMKQIGSTPDYIISSVHAVTQEGQLMIASATGSQISAEAYGAKNIVFVIGAQKIVKNMADGVKRIIEHTVPLEDKRALKAYGGHTSFNKLFIINKENPGRISAIIIKENIGF